MHRFHTSTYYRVMLCIIALNYVAFRAELLEDENKENHPVAPAGIAVAPPTLNWETFDKNNAPEAFTFDAHIAIERLFQTPPPVLPTGIPCERQELIRDKSPPTSAVAS